MCNNGIASVPLAYHTLVYRPSESKFIFFAGLESDGTTFTNLVRTQIADATPQLIDISGGPPPPRYRHAAALNSKLVVFPM